MNYEQAKSRRLIQTDACGPEFDLPAHSQGCPRNASLSRFARALYALPLLLITSGCMQYLVQPPAPSIAGSPHNVAVNSYLGSEIQQPPYVLATECRSGEQLARVLVKRNLAQGLISWVTLGLYAPATIVYECANVADPGIGNTDDKQGAD